MGKGKLAKFADMETYGNVFQYPYSVVSDVAFDMRGKWREQYFGNGNPIVLELGCGKGEYTVGLARKHPECNFIGVDIKGARMWTGATQALAEGLKNVAFLRTNIEIIDRFFSADEVQEIWLTFSDPQMKNPRKRLTSTYFLERYRRFLSDGGIVHVKTDSNFLYTYTTLMLKHNGIEPLIATDDLYGEERGERREGRGEYFGERGERREESILRREAASEIQTYYEKMWLERGLNIKYIMFGLPSNGELGEPDVEIPLDEYRSYHRTKRSTLDTAK